MAVRAAVRRPTPRRKGRPAAGKPGLLPRPPPENPLPVLQLRPAHWERPGSYVVTEDVHVVRGLLDVLHDEVLVLRRALRARGVLLAPASVAVLALHYALRGRPARGEGFRIGVASPGLQLSVATWCELLACDASTVRRAFAELAEHKLLLRVTRQVDVLSLQLPHPDGAIADGFVDRIGRQHLEVQLPSVTYLLPPGRDALDGAAHAGAEDLRVCLAQLLAPSLRILERRFGRTPPVRAAGENASPTTPHLKQENTVPAEAAAEDPPCSAVPRALREGGPPADPVTLLTPEGVQAGLTWRWGDLHRFASLVVASRWHHRWVPQRRVDRRYDCRCGLAEIERSRRYVPPGRVHGPECRLLGTSHPTGRRVYVRRPTFRTQDLVPDLWAARPDLHLQLEAMFIDVFVEAARQEARDFPLAGDIGVALLPPHLEPAFVRRRRWLVRRGELQVQRWQRRMGLRTRRTMSDTDVTS